MGSAVINRYVPSSVSLPGETLEETLEALDMPQAELAKRMGRPSQMVNEIIKGKKDITPETALQLERVLGIPASFWNNRQRQYDEALARQQESKQLEHQEAWLASFPVKEMVKLGWIERHDDTVLQIRAMLNFFGVASPSQWKELWNAKTVAYRKSNSFTADLYAVAAWLRKGELVAQEMPCRAYDESKFRKVLESARALTTEPPEAFVPELQKQCASAGVAVAFVPELPKTRVSGATRWLSSHKALIQLSLRYKSDDHLWFTFFHEAGHILLHSHSATFLEGIHKKPDKQEQEANQFAEGFLIPKNRLTAFLNANKPITKTAIRSFAMSLGISSGIVVGQLQFHGKLGKAHCNDLKKRFAWE